MSLETAIRDFVDAADAYLARHQGPGIADVRAGLAAARAQRFEPHAAMASTIADAHLEPALASLRAGEPQLAAVIEVIAPHLQWVTYDAYPRDLIGDGFAEGHAFASVIGGGAPLPAADYDFGLFLIAPHVLYRDRAHKAPELYAPLTGPHGWRFGPGLPLEIMPAHQPVWNEPYRPHLTKIGPTPLLCLFCWTCDVDEPAVVLPADDWTALEALRLGS
jgi:hypothetical protein